MDTMRSLCRIETSPGVRIDRSSAVTGDEIHAISLNQYKWTLYEGVNHPQISVVWSAWPRSCTRIPMIANYKITLNTSNQDPTLRKFKMPLSVRQVPRLENDKRRTSPVEATREPWISLAASSFCQGHASLLYRQIYYSVCRLTRTGRKDPHILMALKTNQKNDDQTKMLCPNLKSQ